MPNSNHNYNYNVNYTMKQKISQHKGFDITAEMFLDTKEICVKSKIHIYIGDSLSEGISQNKKKIDEFLDNSASTPEELYKIINEHCFIVDSHDASSVSIDEELFIMEVKKFIKNIKK